MSNDKVLQIHQHQLSIKEIATIQEKHVRNTNIELLRIVAMFMIVLHHIVNHAAIVQLTDSNSITRLNNGYFSNPVFYKKLWLLDIGNTLGPIGNAVFIIISGYFLVPKGGEVNIKKSVTKLLTQMFYAAVFLVCFSNIAFHILHVKYKRYIGLMNILDFNSMSWFVGYYFAIILIGYLFLNRYLNKCDEGRYVLSMLTLLAVTQFGWTGGILDSLALNLRTLLGGVLLYSLGGYIKRFDTLKKVRGYVFWLLLVIIYLLVFISSYNTTQNNIEDYNKTSGELFKQTVNQYGNYGILIIVAGLCLFEIFLRMRIPTIKIVNYIASATFIVYLIHDNNFFYSIWMMQDWMTDLHKSPFIFIAKCMEWGIITFAIGVFAYLVYQLIGILNSRISTIFIKK